MEKNEELSVMELEAFQELGVELPFGLEDLVANRLETNNMFNRQKEFTMKNWMYTAAASVTFFALGYLFAPMLNENTVEPSNSELTKYAILLYEDEAFMGDDEALVSEYMAWGEDWGQKGKMAGGEKLSYVSKWYGEDFDNAQAPGTLSGFFIIQAENYDEALAITETHPHTNYGGRIELREIEKL